MVFTVMMVLSKNQQVKHRKVKEVKIKCFSIKNGKPNSRELRTPQTSKKKNKDIRERTKPSIKHHTRLGVTIILRL